MQGKTVPATPRAVRSRHWAIAWRVLLAPCVAAAVVTAASPMAGVAQVPAQKNKALASISGRALSAIPTRRPVRSPSGPRREAEEGGSSADDGVITVVVTGDTGFSRNHSAVHPAGIYKYGRRQPWTEATRGIAPLIDGDVNFTNIETIVTRRNDMRRDLKGQRGPFNFRSHPNGIRQLMAVGFNVFSLSNNHAMDYGVAGLRDTLREMRALGDGGGRRHQGLFSITGIGENLREAAASDNFTLDGHRLAISSIGIATNNLGRHMAGANKPGQAAYRIDSHFKQVTDTLAATPADYRMLSIHYGIEGRVRTDARQIKEWRQIAADTKGIDLVIGHHAHVPRAVERSGNAVIFYGLGNFLHHGTANMGRKGICKDFGVVGRVHLAPDLPQDAGSDVVEVTDDAARNLPAEGSSAEGASTEGSLPEGGSAPVDDGRGRVTSTVVGRGPGRLRAWAVEVTAITNMHMAPRPVTGAGARTRIHALNYLAATLPANPRNTQGGPLRFQVRNDGTGLYCFPGAEHGPGRIGRLCANWSGPTAVPARVRRRVRGSCAS